MSPPSARGGRADQVDAAIGALDVIRLGADMLLQDPETRAFGQWVEAYLAGEAGDLVEFVTGVENTVGRSLRLEHQVAARNRLLREAAEKMTAKTIADALSRYRSTAWPRESGSGDLPIRQRRSPGDLVEGPAVARSRSRRAAAPEDFVLKSDLSSADLR